MNQKSFYNEKLNIKVVLGKFAIQANGVFIEKNDTAILSTLTQESSVDFPGFFPLSVECREHFAAAGKIPGGYFKREGKPTDREILSGRIIDRCLRPLFPKNFFDKVLITSTIYAINPEALPISLALFSASLSAQISTINMVDCAACCDLALIDNEWICFPNLENYNKKNAYLVVAGTFDGINMVEGSFEGVTEEKLIEGLLIAHEKIKDQILWQKEILAALAPIKIPCDDSFNVDYWKEQSNNFISLGAVRKLFTTDKLILIKERVSLWDSFVEKFSTVIEEKKSNLSIIEYAFNSILQEKITSEINSTNKRTDGRDFDTVRQIDSEVGLFSRNHGSGLFTRGKTQLLASLTLGGGEDEARIETLLDETNEPFMLHYNFLPFSVGEARALRAPGRREVGHGHLAANAIKAILPSRSEFPYVIRIVADVISSDGSTSMATVCAASLALMDGGVPIKDSVAGVAMGIISDEKGGFNIITDIAAIEDEFGLMDFKVAGTKDFITAIQMDIKYKGGLPKSLLEKALEKARSARLFILGKMKNTIEKSREKVSSLVPQFTIFKIPREKIGAVIGSGGKVIRELTDRTKTSINIEDDGTVKIFGNPGKMLDYAINIVKTISGDVVPGTEYEGIIKKKVDFGMFIELFPGFDGLLHISSIPRNNQQNFFVTHNEGDKIKIFVVDYDASTSRIRLGLKNDKN